MSKQKSWFTRPPARPRFLCALFLCFAVIDWSIAFFARAVPGAAFLVQFMAGFGFILLLYAVLVWLSAMRRGTRAGNAAGIARRCMELGVYLWAASFILFQAFIFSGIRSDAQPGADYLIVLGAGLRGETPSYVLSERLRTALDYMNENPGTVAVVSGGQGSGESITEAEAMRRYLLRGGIAPERIVKEDKSTSTGENIAFSRAVISGRGAGAEQLEIVVCTSEFHLYRARFICRREGLRATGLPARTPFWYLKAVYFFREYFSVFFMFLGR